MPKSKKSGKNTSSGKKPYSKANKKQDEKKETQDGSELDKNQEWVNLLNQLDEKYQPLNPVPDKYDPKNTPQLNSVFQKKDTKITKESNLILTVLEDKLVVDPPNDNESSDSDDNEYNPILDEESTSPDELTNELTDESTDESTNESTTEGVPADESIMKSDDNSNDDSESNMSNKVLNYILDTTMQAIDDGTNKSDKDEENEDTIEDISSETSESPKNQRILRKRKPTKRNENEDEDEDESTHTFKIFFPASKKIKLIGKDKEYSILINKDEKDLIAYFSELPDLDKDRIIAEEKYIIDMYHNKEPLRIRVINSTLPSQIKSEIFKKMDSSKSAFGTNNKLMTWIDNIMNVPWGKLYQNPVVMSNTPKEKLEYLSSVYNRMDTAVYGHQEAKCHIIQIISKWISNPSSIGNCLALQGPMGVGKTTLVKEGLAPALGRPFNFISLGGVTDSSFLDGHSFTYEGSRPGQIVELIQRSGCMNPIIYFDELDKISKSVKGDEVANMLVHLTDTQQNDCFHDKYFGNINIDLSRAFFVFSYNDESLISPILRDRLQVIKVKGYNISEKTEIARNYMLPRFAREIGFANDQIQILPETISYISSVYAEREDGVRNLGRELEVLVSRLNIIRLIQDSNAADKELLLTKLPFNALKIPIITNPFTITKEIVDNVLKMPVKDEAWRSMYI
jgi:hypothetical protein